MEWVNRTDMSILLDTLAVTDVFWLIFIKTEKCCNKDTDSSDTYKRPFF